MQGWKQHVECKRTSTVWHFWSTSQSPFDACYMSFRSSGSQQFNASNGLQIGVEIKKLEPISQGCEISLWLPNDFAATLFVCEISQPFCAPVKFSWVLPDIWDRLFLIFCFRYLMFKSQFSPCNPPITGFLSCKQPHIYCYVIFIF